MWRAVRGGVNFFHTFCHRLCRVALPERTLERLKLESQSQSNPGQSSIPANSTTPGDPLENAANLRLVVKLGDWTGTLDCLAKHPNGINVVDEEGNTPLSLAIAGETPKHLHIAKLLLKHGACAMSHYMPHLATSQLTRQNSASPLHAVVTSGHIELLKLVHKQVPEELWLIDAAAASSERVGILEIMQMQVPDAFRCMDDSGWTVLERAVEAQSAEAVRILLRHHQQVEHPVRYDDDDDDDDYNNMKCFGLGLRLPRLLKMSIFGFCPDLNVLRLLMQHGLIDESSLKQKNQKGQNILQAALENMSELPWVSPLGAFESPTRQQYNKLDPLASIRRSDLGLAARISSLMYPRIDLVELAKVLRWAGLDLLERDADGYTVMHTAARSVECEDLFEYLHREVGLDVNDAVVAPLNVAVQACSFINVAINVAKLLELGADVHAVDLNDAIANGEGDNQECAMYLIRAGADVDRLGRDGTRPLVKAVMMGSEFLMELLYEHGAREMDAAELALVHR